MSQFMDQLTTALVVPEEAGPCEYKSSPSTLSCGYYTERNKLLTFDGKRKSYCNHHARTETLRAMEALAPQQPNKELLLETFMQIVAHPEEWTQGAWRCNTGMCFAGWATTLAKLPWANPEDTDCDLVLMPNGVSIPVGATAMYLLGLTEEQSNRLFAGDNTLPKITEILQEILGEDSTSD